MLDRGQTISNCYSLNTAGLHLSWHRFPWIKCLGEIAHGILSLSRKSRKLRSSPDDDENRRAS